jgi:hypothetical protein
LVKLRGLARQSLLQFLEPAFIRAVVAKPSLAATDRGFPLGNPSIVNALLPSQSYRNGVLLWVCYIPFGQVICRDGYCNLFALVHIDYGQSINFHGRNSCTQLTLFPTM